MLQLTADDLMMVLSTMVALPVVAWLTVAFFRGRLHSSDEARYIPLLDDEADYWAAPDPTRHATPADGGEAR
jgi:hypothetical protein